MTHLLITVGIVIWLFAGNMWASTRRLAPSAARAIADHETLHAIHELSKMQIQILDGQNQVLDLLKRGVSGGPTTEPS